MMALAAMRDLPVRARARRRDAAAGRTARTPGKVQTIGARFAHGDDHAGGSGGRSAAAPALRRAAAASSSARRRRRRSSARRWACRCRTRRSRPRGQPIWTRHGRALGASARCSSKQRGLDVRDILTPGERPQRDGGPRRVRRLDEPAAAHSRDRARGGPAAADGRGVDRPSTAAYPRLVDVLPNGPMHHPTVRVFLAGGVPEVMLHLRRLGLLDTRRADRRGRHARRSARLVGRLASAARGCAHVLREQRRRRSRRRDHAARTGPRRAA